MGNPFQIEVTISSNVSTPGEIIILMDKKVVLEEKIKILPGEHQKFRFPLVIKENGFHSISAELSAEKDVLFLNNKVDTISYAGSSPKILFVSDPIVERHSGQMKSDANYLYNVLVMNGIDAKLRSWKNLPSKVQEYSGYEAVILNNVPSSFLSPQEMQVIASAVHDLGTGLIIVGGGSNIGSAGYAKTPIEKASPVRFNPSEGKGPSSMNLILIIDKSGSMSEGGNDSKFRMAIDGTQSIIEILGEEDKMGVIAFDETSHIIAAPGLIKNKNELVTKVQGLTPRGSTDFYPALVQANSWLETSGASLKHVILLTDGKTRERDLKALIRKMVENDISISAISIGDDSNVQLLKDIASLGNGRFFRIEDDLNRLPDIFKLDTLMASANTLSMEETFSPRFKDPDPVLSGISLKMPQMHGYLVTSPKKRAIIPIISHREDPIVAFWRYGLGKAAIFTGDDGSRWSRDLVDWDGFGRLWLQLVKRTMGAETKGDEPPLFNIRGGMVEIQYNPYQDGEVANNILAKIISNDGKTSDLRLIQSGIGKYSGIVDHLSPGKYIVYIYKDEKDDALRLAQGSFVINGELEYVDINKNSALLEEIAAQTGGKILSKDDHVFDKFGEGIEQYIPIWPYLFMLAVLLFLADVASYRGIALFKKMGFNN